MAIIRSKSSVFHLSLIALAIMAVTGCSSSGSSGSGSSNPPTDQVDSGKNGGNNGTDGNNNTSTDGNNDTGNEIDSPSFGNVNTLDGVAAGEIFELDSVSIQVSDSGGTFTLQSGPTLNSSASIKVLSDDDNGNARLKVIDPDNSIDITLTETEEGIIYEGSNDARLELISQSIEAQNILGPLLDYAAFGFWSVSGGAGNTNGNSNWFASGYTTQSSNMPDTGNATYSGVSQGFSLVDGEAYDVVGKVEMDVNFSDGDLQGNMADMRSGDSFSAANTPWNGVSFTGNVSGNVFSGSAQVTSSPNSTSLDNDAAGDIQGRFYGPQAEEASAVWSLEDNNGNAAFGAFGARK